MPCTPFDWKDSSKGSRARASTSSKDLSNARPLHPAAGGKVAYCRQPPPRLSVDTSDVILHLYRKGHREVGELAAILRATPERIRRALRRSGVNEPDG